MKRSRCGGRSGEDDHSKQAHENILHMRIHIHIHGHTYTSKGR